MFHSGLCCATRRSTAALDLAALCGYRNSNTLPMAPACPCPFLFLLELDSFTLHVVVVEDDFHPAQTCGYGFAYIVISFVRLNLILKDQCAVEKFFHKVLQYHSRCTSTQRGQELETIFCLCAPR